MKIKNYQEPLEFMPRAGMPRVISLRNKSQMILFKCQSDFKIKKKCTRLKVNQFDIFKLVRGKIFQSLHFISICIDEVSHKAEGDW
jgi:hypothetical protein